MLKCKVESASKHWTSRCGNVYIEGCIISPRNRGLGLGLGLAAHGLGLGLGLAAKVIGRGLGLDASIL